MKPKNRNDEPDRAQIVLERMLWTLRITMTVTIYFSICVIIILVIIGARW